MKYWDAMAEALKKWPVFICYRQVDGTEAADHVANVLDGQQVHATDPETGRTEQFVLNVYQDKNATTVGDWTTTHKENLERARAFIMICTAGASIDDRQKGRKDWVHHEIDWWLENRPTIAPILIDALGAEDRYVPDSILAKWPNAQRTRLVASEWDKLKAPELATEKSRISDLLKREITHSREEFLSQELADSIEREINLTRARNKLRRLNLAALVLLLIASAAAIFAIGKSEEAGASAEIAQSNEKTALTNQARALAALSRNERQAGRPATAVRLSLAAVAAMRTAGLEDLPEGWASLYAASRDNHERAVFRGHGAAVWRAAFSPDGERVVAASEDGTARVWAADGSGEPVIFEGHGDWVWTAAFSPDGERVVTGSSDGIARVW
ncbi:MAG: hypothetical protein OEU92_12705, partial [Alphaproteobacteria bacterium]|nr:hypothetical protein [Alphaproteobacteria bacterium]